MNFIRSLVSGRTSEDNGNKDNNDDKKPPAAGGLLRREPPPPTTEEAQQKLKRAIAAVNKRVLALETAVEKQDGAIRKLMQSGERKQAAKLVPALKRDQRLLDQERGKLTNLRDQMGMTDAVQTARVVAEAYKASTQVSRAQLGQFNRDEIDMIIADSRELKAGMEEINDLLAESVASSSDQARLDELEAEAYLDTMMQEDDDLLAGYEEPVTEASGPVTAPRHARRLAYEQGY